MDLQPEDVIASFLQDAEKRGIKAVVFAAFDRNGQLVLRGNHTLPNESAKAALVMKFLQFDDRAVEAAATVIQKVTVPDKEWNEISADVQTSFKAAAAGALQMAVLVATTNCEAPPVEPPKIIV